jgi:hypothetical protein
MKSWNDFCLIHLNNQKDGQRPGQRFVNMYIKHSWPELFYTDEYKSAELICRWLEDNQYFDELPPVVNPIFKENGELN